MRLFQAPPTPPSPHYASECEREFANADMNKDGKVTLPELLAFVESIFKSHNIPWTQEAKAEANNRDGEGLSVLNATTIAHLPNATTLSAPVKSRRRRM